MYGGGGTLINQGTINADQSGGATGGTIAIHPNSFTNLGTVLASGSEGPFDLWAERKYRHGGVYGVRQPVAGRNHLRGQRSVRRLGRLDVESGGAWTDNSTLTVTGGTLGNLGDQNNYSTNSWTNAGTIMATNSTVNLGGVFTLAGLGTFHCTGDSVSLVGTLNNTGTTLALNAATGSWNWRAGRF